MADDDDETDGQRTDNDDGTDDGSDGQRTDDDDGTDDGTDGRTEYDGDGDGTDTTGRTDERYIYICIYSFKLLVIFLVMCW